MKRSAMPKRTAMKRTPKKDPIPRAVRRVVMARADDRCELCGGHGTLVLHHRQPVGRGGLHTAENLAALHPTCHVVEVHGNPEWAIREGFTIRTGVEH